MIVTIKIFYEKSTADMHEYNTLWEENRDRFIYLQSNLSVKYQQDIIKHNIKENNNKDILAVRFPSNIVMKKNKIINDAMVCKGFIYDTNKIWYPKEVWIYNPVY